MVRLVIVRIGVSVLADEKTSSWTWRQQVHLVRVNEHRTGMSP